MAYSLSLSKKRNFYFLYTAVFLLCAVLCFWQFYLNGKSFVWKNDGLYQHYNSFVYLGTYIRNVLRTLIIEHKLVIPMWENSIGYGGDVFTTLSYYVFGDPFALVSVLTPTRFAEWGYGFSVVLRMFASGIAFCAYCKKTDCTRPASLCGSIVYIFSVFALFAGVRHPYFINPMIYLPLLFLGVEKVFKSENPHPLMLTVFVAAVSNFYFFYMLAIILAIYALVRLLSIYNITDWKPVVINLLKIAFFSFIGILMAALLFLPNCMAFLENTRVNNVYKYNFLYNFAHYGGLFSSFVSITGPKWAYVGMAPFAYVGAAANLLKGGKHNWQKHLLVVFSVFLVFPFFGHVFNGFGYVCNRWTFAWAFLISFMFVKGLPILENGIGKKRKLVIALCGIIYTVIIYVIKVRCKEASVAGCALLMTSICFMYMWDNGFYIRFKKCVLKKKTVFCICSMMLAILCVTTQSRYMYSPESNAYVKEFNDRGYVNKKLNKQYSVALKHSDKNANNGFWRVENSRYQHKQLNYPLTSGIGSTGMYWSLINPNIQEYFSLTSAENNLNYRIYGLNSRAMLLPFSSVKYFVSGSSPGSKKTVPYGFNYVGDTEGYDDTYLLYETENVLPFGYTYSKTISLAEFKKLSFAERQQSMLQAAVVDDDSIDYGNVDFTFNENILQYDIKCGDGVIRNGNEFTVTEPSASIYINFNSTPDNELYLELKGMNFDSANYHKSEFAKEFGEERLRGKLKLLKKEIMYAPATSCVIKAYCDGATDMLTHYTDYDKYASGRRDYFLNLCYSKNPRTQIELCFNKVGTYSFDDISVIEQPLTEFENNINSLKQESLQNLSFTANNIKGDITISKNKLLCLSLSYSKGWTAFIDGKEANLIRTNVMYSGVELSAGTHTVELKYETPYLKLGFIITIIGFTAAAVITVLHKRRRGKNGQDIYNSSLL